MAQVTVCRTDEVPSGSAFCTRLPSGLRVAVAHLGESGFIAFENRCPHADGPVGNGQVRGDTIVCPWHFFRFDLKTGKPVGMESVLQLKLFPVVVNDGEISIDI
jgi:nitrite reductase/ring-hydroxylating ferredoxin subunit